MLCCGVADVVCCCVFVRLSVFCDGVFVCVCLFVCVSACLSHVVVVVV